MGKDKFENEDMIAYGWPEDVWFHVDKFSSAHVYLRTPPPSTALVEDQKLQPGALSLPYPPTLLLSSIPLCETGAVCMYVRTYLCTNICFSMCICMYLCMWMYLVSFCMYVRMAARPCIHAWGTVAARGSSSARLGLGHLHFGRVCPTYG